MINKFEYKCVDCKRVEGSNDPDAELFCDCSAPYKTQMKRVYSFGGAIFKGSGWYSVDKRKTDGGIIGID